MSERVSWSVKEYANRHGISTRTVQRLIAAGRLNVIRFTSRTIRIVPRSASDAETIRQEAPE